MKKFKCFIEITEKNFVKIALMPCVREVRKDVIQIAGISAPFMQPVLFVVVGSSEGTIGDVLVQDVCDNWHIMTMFDYERRKDEEI